MNESSLGTKYSSLVRFSYKQVVYLFVLSAEGLALLYMTA